MAGTGNPGRAGRGAVAPGIIATEGLTAAIPPDVRDQIAVASPVRRLGSEQDVAAAVR